MKTDEALRVIESVLNQQKAVARLYDVLEPVMQAEVYLAELEQKKVVLGAEIAALEVTAGEVLKGIEDTKTSAQVAHALTMAELAKAEDERRAAVNAAEVQLNDLKDKAKLFKAAQVGKEKAMAERIAVLQADADAAAERLAKIEAKIAELKGM